MIEESQYPPVLMPLEIAINSYLNEFPKGVIGKVHASDQDPYDVLTYSIVPSHTGTSWLDFVEIDPQDGTLTTISSLDSGEYYINVSVSDGKFVSNSVVKISVDIVTDETLENAVVIRVRDVSPQNFVLSHKRGFLRAIRSSLGVRARDVVIISVQLVPGKKRSTRNHFSDKRRGSRILSKKFFQKFNNQTLLEKNRGKKELNKKNRRPRQLHDGDMLDVLFAVKKSQNPSEFFSPEAVSTNFFLIIYTVLILKSQWFDSSAHTTTTTVVDFR